MPPNIHFDTSQGYVERERCDAIAKMFQGVSVLSVEHEHSATLRPLRLILAWRDFCTTSSTSSFMSVRTGKIITTTGRVENAAERCRLLA